MKLSFIYMASGFGKRFGSNKLLVPLKGKELYRHGLDCLCEAAENLRTGDGKNGYEIEILVVSQYDVILKKAAGLGLGAVPNAFSAQGITASLRLGAQAAGTQSDAYLFSVADQPYMRPDTLAGFVQGYIRSGMGIGCMCHHGKRGNPAIFSSRYREELLALRGDRGGSVIMKAHPGDVWTMEVLEEELKDIDRGEDLPQS